MDYRHIYEIDMLRVVGAASVLLYHYTYRGSLVDGIRIPLFPVTEIATKYGYLGVSMFFMISGFVILFSALHKSPLRFAISRMDRLYPAYWIAVSLTALTVITFTDITVSPLHYLMNLTMINDYFDIPSIDAIYWTLHVELKFYFLIFVLMLLKQVKRYHIWIPIWLGATITYMIAQQPFFMGWFINPYYSPFFISGILFYLIYAEGFSWKKVILLVISLSASIYNSVDQIGGFIMNPTTTDKVIVSIILISLNILFLSIVTRKLTIKGSAMLVAAGGMTYPIYLLHARIGKILFNILSQDLNKYVVLMTITLFVISLSFAVYTF